MKYWIIKSEPHKYSWDQMVKDGSTSWDGIKNYTARINLRDMQIGDVCLFYHSNDGKEIVGITEVIKTAHQDPTTDDDRWVAVGVKAVKPLKKPVNLQMMKADAMLSQLELVRISRLSVSKVSEDEYNRILMLSEQ